MKFLPFYISTSIDLVIFLVLFPGGKKCFMTDFLVFCPLKLFLSPLLWCSLIHKCRNCNIDTFTGVGYPMICWTLALCPHVVFCDCPIYCKEKFLWREVVATLRSEDLGVKKSSEKRTWGTCLSSSRLPQSI